MSQSEPLIRNISDTALWAAAYRARETASPGLLELLQRNLQKPLEKADAPLKFGPREGPLFFAPHGWKPIDVHSIIKAAARIKRLSLWMRFLAMFPESSAEQGSRPWSGICLLSANS